VKYETEVNVERTNTQTVTDPPLLTTLVKIILGTGFFMVVAVVLGVAFGGVRVLAKSFSRQGFLTRPETDGRPATWAFLKEKSIPAISTSLPRETSI